MTIRPLHDRIPTEVLIAERPKHTTSTDQESS